MNRMTDLSKLIGKIKREHDLTMSAYGRWARVSPSTATGQKHYADYERHAEELDKAIDAANEFAATLKGTT